MAQQEWITLCIRKSRAGTGRKVIGMPFQSGVTVHVKAGLMAILGALYLVMGILLRRKAKQNSADSSMGILPLPAVDDTAVLLRSTPAPPRFK